MTEAYPYHNHPLPPAPAGADGLAPAPYVPEPALHEVPGAGSRLYEPARVPVMPGDGSPVIVSRTQSPAARAMFPQPPQQLPAAQRAVIPTAGRFSGSAPGAAAGAIGTRPTRRAIDTEPSPLWKSVVPPVGSIAGRALDRLNSPTTQIGQQYHLAGLAVEAAVAGGNWETGFVPKTLQDDSPPPLARRVPLVERLQELQERQAEIDQAMAIISITDSLPVIEGTWSPGRAPAPGHLRPSQVLPRDPAPQGHGEAMLAQSREETLQTILGGLRAQIAVIDAQLESPGADKTLRETLQQRREEIELEMAQMVVAERLNNETADGLLVGAGAMPEASDDAPAEKVSYGTLPPDEQDDVLGRVLAGLRRL